MLAIEIRNLSKNFGEKMAVNNLSLEVEEGAIYGFIGENGSGKSTTEKLICGLLNPSSGSIKLFGKDHREKGARDGIGVLIESPGCFPNISVYQNMMIQADNLGIKDKKAEIARVLKLVRMEGAASNKFKNCSLGMKQRIGIAFALLGHPRLLILDEPINGLDADGMRIMREILTSISKKEKVTVLISSHVLSELEKIATHYGIIKDGRLIAQMTAEELEKDAPGYIYLKGKDEGKILAKAKKRFDEVAEEEGYVRIYDSVSPESVMDYFHAQKESIEELGYRKKSLAEYYETLIRGKGGRKNAY